MLIELTIYIKNKTKLIKGKWMVERITFIFVAFCCVGSNDWSVENYLFGRLIFIALGLTIDPLNFAFLGCGKYILTCLVHIPKGYWIYTDTILTKIIVVGTDGIKLVLYKNQYWIYTDHIPKPNWILDQNRQI